MNFSPLAADRDGQIYAEPSLHMVISRAGQWSIPKTEDMIPLPAESELFLLPGRRAVGLDPATGRVEEADGLAVAAFVAPGHTLSAHPAYMEEEDAPTLPLFAYGAAGYADDRVWVAAKLVDNDPRQRFASIRPGRIEREGARLVAAYPKNRLVAHIVENCVRRYACPAARNFALGRFEAPLPTATACNARCIGCISMQGEDSPIAATPQCRMKFTPTAREVAEVMFIHASRERKRPIYSFGQGCEGDPLLNAPLLAESIALFRKGGGKGTVNCNTNASRPDALPALAEAGLTSLRASLNSARPELYAAYYRPQGYDFAAVRETLRIAAELGIYASLNLLYFPGITDTWAEVNALGELCAGCRVNMVQLRNLNIDPLWYARKMGINLDSGVFEPAMGLRKFMKNMKKACPWLKFGYFNPYVEQGQ